ncbi:MAG: hypothetical protein P4M14_03265 [Gammaproteobacteria bacterium]|nr:hypothetical protein [Gammaproteobacteria bacterium]
MFQRNRHVENILKSRSKIAFSAMVITYGALYLSTLPSSIESAYKLIKSCINGEDQSLDVTNNTARASLMFIPEIGALHWAIDCGLIDDVFFASKKLQNYIFHPMVIACNVSLELNLMLSLAKAIGYIDPIDNKDAAIHFLTLFIVLKNIYIGFKGKISDLMLTPILAVPIAGIYGSMTGNYISLSLGVQATKQAIDELEICKAFNVLQNITQEDISRVPNKVYQYSKTKMSNAQQAFIATATRLANATMSLPGSAVRATYSVTANTLNKMPRVWNGFPPSIQSLLLMMTLSVLIIKLPSDASDKEPQPDPIAVLLLLMSLLDYGIRKISDNRYSFYTGSAHCISQLASAARDNFRDADNDVEQYTSLPSSLQNKS